MPISREYEGPKDNIFLTLNNEIKHVNELVIETVDEKNPKNLDDDTIVLNAQ